MNYTNDDIKESLLKTQRQKLAFCDRLFLWWFFHSGPGFYSSNNYESINLYCSCLDCCPGCLELEFNSNIYCEKNCVCFLVCCTFSFV
jgi:hypothetical protein